MSIPANPPPTKLPEKLDRDFELSGFFNDLLRSLYMIWARTGSGAGTVPPAGLPPPIESIANLTTVADDMLYTTAPDTYATSTIEAVGRAFLAEATIADERDYLGLVAGGAGDIWVEKLGDTMTGDLVMDADITFTGTGRLAWTKITADAVTLGPGTTPAGLVSDVQVKADGNYYHIDEVSGGMTLIVDFVSVTAFNWVQISAWYAGSAQHAGITMQLWDWNASAWENYNFLLHHVTVGTIADDMMNCDFLVPNDINYIGTAGNAGEVRVRLHHSASGNAAHDMDIDVVALYQ
jgi:hypothetical protein